MMPQNLPGELATSARCWGILDQWCDGGSLGPRWDRVWEVNRLGI